MLQLCSKSTKGHCPESLPGTGVFMACLYRSLKTGLDGARSQAGGAEAANNTGYSALVKNEMGPLFMSVWVPIARPGRWIVPLKTGIDL